jgi:membrane-bound lytic murein transglycosylase A
MMGQPAGAKTDLKKISGRERPFPARPFPARISPALVLLAAFFLTACPAPPPAEDQLTLTQTTFQALPGWQDDTLAAALPAFLTACGTILKKKDDQPVTNKGGNVEAYRQYFGSVGDWRQPCMAAQLVEPGNEAAAKTFFETWFTPYLAANNDQTEGLFTGYFEPELRGSHTYSPDFPVPLYRRPADLVSVDLGLFREEWRGQRLAGRLQGRRLLPFASRAEINDGALREQGLELVWVDDPVDAFFLHVQGSGRIVLEDGSVLRVGYAAQNGHDYVSIGRRLIKRGAMEKDAVSLQTIRAWLRAHPDEATALLEENPSYVFFQELTPPANGGTGAPTGPIGAQGVPLTPGRSLAVDRLFLPLGIPLWLDTKDPLDVERSLRRLVVAQDTGGAIKGPVRGDIFFGFGGKAEAQAGRMNARGRYYLLLPKSIAGRDLAQVGAGG